MNLFAYRDTDPATIMAVEDPIGRVVQGSRAKRSLQATEISI